MSYRSKTVNSRTKTLCALALGTAENDNAAQTRHTEEDNQDDNSPLNDHQQKGAEELATFSTQTTEEDNQDNNSPLNDEQQKAAEELASVLEIEGITDFDEHGEQLSPAIHNRQDNSPLLIDKNVIQIQEKFHINSEDEDVDCSVKDPHYDPQSSSSDSEGSTSNSSEYEDPPHQPIEEQSILLSPTTSLTDNRQDNDPLLITEEHLSSPKHNQDYDQLLITREQLSSPTDNRQENSPMLITGDLSLIHNNDNVTHDPTPQPMKELLTREQLSSPTDNHQENSPMLITGDLSLIHNNDNVTHDPTPQPMKEFLTREQLSSPTDNRQENSPMLITGDLSLIHNNDNVTHDPTPQPMKELLTREQLSSPMDNHQENSPMLITGDLSLIHNNDNVTHDPTPQPMKELLTREQLSSPTDNRQENSPMLITGDLSLIHNNDNVTHDPTPQPMKELLTREQLSSPTDNRQENSPMLITGDLSLIHNNDNVTHDPTLQPMNEAKNKTRKRIRKESTWKRNVKKYKVNSGQAYTTKLGKVHREKTLKPPCTQTCKFKCAQAITGEQRSCIMGNFYKLADKTRQREYILKCTELIPAKEKTTKQQENTMQSRRQPNCSYWFEVDGKKIRVCKFFFMATLDICNNTIATTLKKTTDGFLKPEMRGTGPSINKTEEDLIKDVKAHINSFERVESHYCRARTEREYIDGNLNLTLMYKLYKELCEINNKKFVNEPVYRNIFNTKFNISFFKPKKDQCAFCVSYENSTENEKLKKKSEYDTHKENVQLSRLEKQKDKNEFAPDTANQKRKRKNKEANTENNDGTNRENPRINDVVLATFDLQAVIPLPNGNISTFFYKSKLNMYNFTVYNVASRQGYCYVWHEGIAKRGAIEIATCVYTFLKEHCQGKKEVIFYSDNASSQNKNKFLFCMYLDALNKLNIEKITHKYLIVGHTENEGDSIHATIEREKNRMLKHGPIYVPTEVEMIIKNAKKNHPMYQLKELETEEFIDWKKVNECTGSNFTFNNLGEKCVWKEVKMIQVSKNDPGIIKYKTSYREAEYTRQIKVRNKRVKVRRNENITYKKAYTEPPAIATKKLKGLLELCASGAIPQRHHYFFHNLKGGNTTHREDEGAL